MNPSSSRQRRQKLFAWIGSHPGKGYTAWVILRADPPLRVRQFQLPWQAP
jgi:hypothetical protein